MQMGDGAYKGNRKLGMNGSSELASTPTGTSMLTTLDKRCLSCLNLRGKGAISLVASGNLYNVRAPWCGQSAL